MFIQLRKMLQCLCIILTKNEIAVNTVDHAEQLRTLRFEVFTKISKSKDNP